MVPRFLYPNRVWDPAALLYASSADPAAPPSFIKDQLRSKTWRSLLGWNVGAGFNDKFDFLDNGVAKLASLVAGNYAAGAALAAQLTTAMNAVAGITNTYLVTYANGQFTLARATGANAFGIKLAAVDAASCALDLGYNLGADKLGQIAYTADLVAYHSREWLKANLGSALACAAGIALNHNVGAGGKFTLQGSASDAWTAPTVSQALSGAFSDPLGNGDARIAYFGSSAQQWWRLLIEDVQNAAGYSEVGIWYAGPYAQPAITYSVDFTRRFVELSNLEFAPAGAHFQDQKPRRRVWTPKWIEILDADRVVLEAAAAAAPKGRNLFMAFDATGDTTNIGYGFLSQDLEDKFVSGNYWTMGFEFSEALG